MVDLGLAIKSELKTEMKEPMYVVTGASAGIGQAVAREIAVRHLPVVAVARSAGPLHELAANCAPYVTAVVADLGTRKGVEQVAYAMGEQACKGIVHCAGSLVPLEPYRMLDASELERHFSIHVGTPIAMNQALSVHAPIGRVMFIDSYSAITPRDGWSAYSIVKSAAQMAARCAAQELRGTNVIRVFPGAVKTQIVDAVMGSDTETARVFGEILKRGEFADPADTAKFLAALLIDAPDALIGSQESWDYNNHEHRTLAQDLASRS